MDPFWAVATFVVGGLFGAALVESRAWIEDRRSVERERAAEQRAEEHERLERIRQLDLVDVHTTRDAINDVLMSAAQAARGNVAEMQRFNSRIWTYPTIDLRLLESEEVVEKLLAALRQVDRVVDRAGSEAAGKALFEATQAVRYSLARQERRVLAAEPLMLIPADRLDGLVQPHRG